MAALFAAIFFNVNFFKHFYIDIFEGNNRITILTNGSKQRKKEGY